MPNEREARTITGTEDTEEAIEQLRRTVPTLVVKRGHLGASVYRGTFTAALPPVEVKVADAVGAGDSFNAGFLAAYLNGDSLLDCLARGNLIAALSTTRAGGTTAFRDQSAVNQFVMRHGHLASLAGSTRVAEIE